MKKQLQIGVGDARQTAKGFIEAWKKAEQGDTTDVAYRLHFESLEMLLRVLTPARGVLLRRLRQTGPTSIRTLSRELDRDYKTVHGNVKLLIAAGRIERNADDRVEVPWDVVEARLNLAA